jgi:deoxyribodipyrimidine photo-lyase
MIHDSRIKILSAAVENPAGQYVLYWMQQAQRAQYNHALEYALREATWLRKPVVVIFGITDRYPQASERHYAFMLQGLQQTQQTLARRGIQMLVRHQPPAEAAMELSKQACLVVVDAGYLRLQKQWRTEVARSSPVRVIQVESDVVVPAEVASDKEEFAARTLRPRIARVLEQYLQPLPLQDVAVPSLHLLPADPRDLDLTNLPQALARLKIDRSVPAVTSFTGGYSQADALLSHFIERKLRHYDERRNEPAGDGISHLSPYLHFGQISPLEIALRVREAAAAVGQTGVDVYLEELIVRRELSINFVHYNPAYDCYTCLPSWAQQTLSDHASDHRLFIYSYEQFEQAQTHDPYWNAAQREMVFTGKMHNYMRMYWGKKIIEWTRTPEEAFSIALKLNNTWELDGRDANSFTGIAWCFGKHDRPWTRRPIFGTVRYMNAQGLERKFDMQAYLRKVGQPTISSGSLF